MSLLSVIWQDLKQSGQSPPFVLIDCAGIEGGAQHLPRQIFSELECLFTGDLADELADVGPYLARLTSYSDEVRDAVGDLLERQVGMLVVSAEPEPGAKPLSFAQLHRHFRKFNVVYDPGGKPLFWRYYDSRVLLEVLSVMTPAQLLSFFELIASFFLLTATDGIAKCSCDDGKLGVTI